MLRVPGSETMIDTIRTGHCFTIRSHHHTKLVRWDYRKSMDLMKRSRDHNYTHCELHTLSCRVAIQVILLNDLKLFLDCCDGMHFHLVCQAGVVNSCINTLEVYNVFKRKTERFQPTSNLAL